ncbi:MAG: SpoIIE family protein phosphatase [Candidatus Latescibacterota bacterium]|nr:MAG: SpoIIE family protein phosphatase [Candidatus Latescibacterota bacterium]
MSDDSEQRPTTRRFSRFASIRFIVSAATVAVVSSAVVGVGTVGERHVRSVLTKEIETRMLMTARNLARMSASSLLSEFPELTLHPVIKEIQSDHPELASVVVVDHRGQIQGHADVRSLGSSYRAAADLRMVRTDHVLAPGEGFLSNPENLVARVPVRHPSGAEIGLVYVSFHRSHLEAAVTASRRQQAIMLPLFLALAIASALVLMTVLLRPIAKLRSGLERIGRGDLDTPIELRDRTEFQMLAESINDMASQLRTAQEQMMDKERLKHEMELARQIQGSLLPASSLVADDFEILGVHQAAAEVGGDYFDVLELPDGRIGIAIADVSGKGLAGCLVMSMVAVLLRSLRRAYSQPTELLVALDEQLSGNLRPGVFVTMFYGVLDPKAGRLIYASAGHTPVLVHRAASGEVEWHYTQGIPIGAVRGGALKRTIEDRELELHSGDTLVQFTDGVNEAWEPKEMQQFGFQRVEEVVKHSARRGAKSVVNGIRRSLVAWTGDLPRMDDETVVVVHRVGKPGDIQRTTEERDLSHDLVEQVWLMRESGHQVELRADAQELAAIRHWLRSCPHLQDLPEPDLVLLEHALHEHCSNVIEHGYQMDSSGTLDLWWIPDGNIWNDYDSRNPELLRNDPGLLERIHAGVFLIRDHGAPFPPSDPCDSDLESPDVRKRGRGLGLRIIQEVMNPLMYQHGGVNGNLTIMRFDPMQTQPHREARHVPFPG